MPYGESGIPPGGVEPVDFEIDPATGEPVYTQPPPTTTTPPPTTTTPPPEGGGNGGLLSDAQDAVEFEEGADAPSVQDLYSEVVPTAVADVPEGVTATEAATQDAVAGVADVTGTAEAATGEAVDALAEGYDPESIAVGGEMTVAGQLEDITSADAPLMRLARQQGMLSAARRGLQNSSIAAGAAQAETVRQALPIAQQDAATYFQAARDNMAAANRAAEFGASAENIAELQNAAEQNRITALTMSLGTDVSKFNADQLNEAERINAQMQTAVSQGNADAYNKAQQQLAQLQTEADLTSAEQNFRSSLQAVDATNRMNQQVLQQNSALNAQYLAGTQARDLATIQGQYQQLISTNETAAQLFNSYFTGISDIMANKDISPERVAQYIQVQQQMLESSLKFMSELNTLNLGDISLPGAYSPGKGEIVPVPA